MSRPRLLYVPLFLAEESERFAATVGEWAEVASFDIPPDRGVEAALARLDELGWEDAVVVADSQAQPLAVAVTDRHPDRVRAVALSHAVGRYRFTGERPALHPEVVSAAGRLLDTDYMAFWRAVTQFTQGGLPDAWVERWAAAIPQARAKAFWSEIGDSEPAVAERLRDYPGPVLLGQHKDCVLWTQEGFEDAVAALPEAKVVRCREIPVFDPAFGEALRQLAGG